jgi:hypothetical protein
MIVFDIRLISDLLQLNPLYVDTKHTIHHSINFERDRHGSHWACGCYLVQSVHFSRVCRLPSEHTSTFIIPHVKNNL